MGKPYRRPTPWAKWLKRGMMYNLLLFFSLPETSSTKHTHTHLVLKWRQGRWMRAYVVGQMLGARCMFHNLIGIKQPMITSTNVNLHHEPSTLLSPLYRKGSEVLNNLPVITQLEMEWAEPPGLPGRCSLCHIPSAVTGQLTDRTKSAVHFERRKRQIIHISADWSVNSRSYTKRTKGKGRPS